MKSLRTIWKELTGKSIVKWFEGFTVIVGGLVITYKVAVWLNQFSKVIPVITKLEQTVTNVEKGQNNLIIQVDSLSKITNGVKTEVRQVGGEVNALTNSYTNFIQNRPEITKEDMILYLQPIYEELKKNRNGIPYSYMEPIPEVQR